MINSELTNKAIELVHQMRRSQVDFVGVSRLHSDEWVLSMIASAGGIAESFRSGYPLDNQISHMVEFIVIAIYRLETLVEDHVDTSIFGLIKFERSKQDEKWGNQRHDGHKWMKILAEEIGELFQSDLQKQARAWQIDEMVQTIAVAVAWLEQLIEEEE